MEMWVSATMRKVEQRLNHPRSGRQPNLDDDTWPGASQRFNVTIENGGHHTKNANKALDRKVKGKRLGKTNAKLTGCQCRDLKMAAEEKERMELATPSSTSTPKPKPKMKLTVISEQNTSLTSSGSNSGRNISRVDNFVNMAEKSNGNGATNNNSVVL